MNDSENKTISEFISAYKNGQRKFANWNFNEDNSVEGLDLQNIHFEECFLFLNLRNTNLANAKFITCNIKTADFRGANMTNAIIKNCRVEGVMFKGAITDQLVFKENYCHSTTVGQDDFETFFKETDID
ncbi:pentapeptide repeat-containing protein [Aquimarina sp. U1-2]|uniref:pentapeptide repeat-containing protein n=1 Tax=Aquimarina sp. U1-2 TaxID=2823141 RepID=UPI001AEC7391|nr:pentapeptide repeat-containing protein [Aquimarina sp. U1-2]